MLQVSNRSWHYRLWRFGRESYNEPRDLCRYFWHILIVKLFFPGVILTLAVTGVVLLGILIWNNLAKSAIIVAIIILTLVCIIGIGYFLYYLDKRSKAKKETRKLLPPREPGIIRSFILAKKSKICPLINVVEE